MTEFAAHALAATVNCKIDGCANQAVSARGRYAKLCEEHIGEARRTVAKPDAGSEQKARVAPSIKEAAQKIVPAAADLDKALGRRQIARDDARKAFAVFKRSLEELQQTAREALA